MNTNEKSHTEIFWLTLIKKVFGIINPEEYIEFQKKVRIEHVKFIFTTWKSRRKSPKLS